MTGIYPLYTILGGADSMGKDNGRHREIREDVLDSLKGCDILSSHTKNGDITVSFNNSGKRIDISQPDIVVLKDNRARAIIEVELSSQPKHLLGVAIANSLAEFGRYKNCTFDIDDFDLFIIVDSKPTEKDGSSKPEQIKAIKSKVDEIFRKMWKDSGKVRVFDIKTDNDFKDCLAKAFS